MVHKTDKDLQTIISTVKRARIILTRERFSSLLGIRDRQCNYVGFRSIKKTTQTGTGASSSQPDDEESEGDESYDLLAEDAPPIVRIVENEVKMKTNKADNIAEAYLPPEVGQPITDNRSWSHKPSLGRNLPVTACCGRPKKRRRSSRLKPLLLAASGLGGQPGKYTSTGISLSTPGTFIVTILYRRTSFDLDLWFNTSFQNKPKLQTLKDEMRDIRRDVTNLSNQQREVSPHGRPNITTPRSNGPFNYSRTTEFHQPPHFDEELHPPLYAG
ncbi:hypothetical protein M9H77_02795 [Catharanthus roseus]|uniref:Uncharacterized protein n=1 Tax=Catharanthus roseus TaxID=4058 RepID=A0ACC0C9P7_CATRO|nr:hypothetical protein M9H77_02795 [Catharanthus roseus]